jgi:lipopolysaccharide export LptBFGC system permease protein LptF
LSLATALAVSPLSSVELRHGSGSVSVVGATYLFVFFSISVKGLSVWLGHQA